MTVSLMFRNAAADTADRTADNWTAIKTAAGHEHGYVFLAEETVQRVGRIVGDAVLANGETVSAYECSEEDADSEYYQGAYIPAFGPSLLSVELQDRVRDVLAQDENGKAAVALFNTVLGLGLQIGLQGKECIDAHMKGVNWIADEIEINRTASNMLRMMDDLGLGHTTAEDRESGEVELDHFVAAVAANGFYTGLEARLQAFIECAQRNGATHVYWA